MTNEKKKRRRTGCLTCRARRVKCDEGVPTCARCSASNVECLGYEQTRRVDLGIQRRRRVSNSPIQAVTRFTEGQLQNDHVREGHHGSSPRVEFRSDGVPLVGLPNLPLASQRPHSAAREILAYHQYLFRTSTILFAADHLHFWRDQLCQEAWETEYVYHTIAALGGIHRATLLMSSTCETEKSRSIDTKVIALQAYTKALQGLSENLEEAKRSLDILIGVLLLLAYVECFVCNVPAALRHVRVAYHYFSSEHWSAHNARQHFSLPIKSCLQNLQRTCRIALPIPRITTDFHDLRALRSDFDRDSNSLKSSDSGALPSAMLKRLFDLASAGTEMHDLIWNPLVCKRQVSQEKVQAFQAEVRKWKISNSYLLPHFDSENTLATISSFDRNTIVDFSIPPPQYDIIISSNVRLSAALYNFYLARTMWALSLLSHDSERYELSAWIYCYDVMRWCSTVSKTLIDTNGGDGIQLPCETLNSGFLPMLYGVGQISPGPAWMRWIVECLNHIEREGLFNGRILSGALNALLALEMRNSIRPSTLRLFSRPHLRVMSILFPEENGCGLIAYFTGRRSDGIEDNFDSCFYYLLSHARWQNRTGYDIDQPLIEYYDETDAIAEPFTEEWLYNQNIIRNWIAWAGDANFSLDGILRDHINGSRL